MRLGSIVFIIASICLGIETSVFADDDIPALADVPKIKIFLNEKKLNKILDELDAQDWRCYYVDDIRIEIDANDPKFQNNRDSIAYNNLFTPTVQDRLENFVDSAAAGVFSTVVTYPFDQRRLLQQYGKGNLVFWSDPRLWYRGMQPQLMAYASSSGVGMCLYEGLKANGWAPAWAGAVTTMISNLITNPMLVFRMQRSLAPKDTFYRFSDFRNDLRQNPFMAYRGKLMMTIFSFGPQAGYYTLYEEMNRRFRENPASASYLGSEFVRSAISAGTARVIASVFSYPLETMRTFRVKDGSSYTEIISKLYAENGLRRFYVGFPMASFRATAITTAFFASYEQIKNFRRPRDDSFENRTSPR